MKRCPLGSPWLCSGMHSICGDLQKNCTRPSQLIISARSGARLQRPPLFAELLASAGCWEKVTFRSVTTGRVSMPMCLWVTLIEIGGLRVNELL